MKEIAAVGDVLAGKYRVTKILGIGGMGMVVAATHLELDQRVALKFMLPSSADSPESAARFLREARAAGRLNSEHVCRVMDVGRFDTGVPYIVMEYLQGENLGAVLRRRGPLRVSEAVDYILQGIEGLAEAHAHGIIHRDLKPDNLFLHKRNDGGVTVKVLDFGISKIAVEGLSTKTGDIMGSPAYMAPEQMESSRNVDHRTDIWSLGVVLYQLVVGKPPFQGETLPLLCMHVVNDDPVPMSEVRGDLPDGFEAVVMRCLQKEPPDRFADVGELAHALAPFGPKTSNTSASRIQIVLRRTTKKDSAATISHEFTKIEPTADHAPPDARPGQAGADKSESTTFGRTAGQSIATSRIGGPSRGVAGAIAIAIGIAALVIVMVWRSSRAGQGLDDPSAIAKPSTAPRPPPPIVEPIVEDPPASAPGAPSSAPSPPSAPPVADSPPAVAPPPQVTGAVGSPAHDSPKLDPRKKKLRRPPGR
ncbi:MAG TPA: serine/threonine-protein kinase, partial [Kofleriaceae bacterium]|nr:serine/threonine-protein kinase [Kofleriaceae bacterium]